MANEEITLTFREAMNELSAIVEALESNTLELEESLVKYERGVALLRYLKSSLADAQQKVEVLHGRARYEHRRYANRHRTFQGLIPPDRCGVFRSGCVRSRPPSHR